jgi:mono/diheme cytochrome c family protein
METTRLAAIARPLAWRSSALLLLAWAVAQALVGVQPAWAGEAAVSQCVACHTDAAKLKALTPPDPPPSEEGEG